jgi:2-keto-4-pentenoate hydratase/2-oxohepta-3-ene-1,7-dioic acid hydratase in catechol pathway
VIGPNEPVFLDASISDRLDYEVELGVIIGKPGKNITEEAALDHVFGYTIINDVSARDLQRRHEQWFKGKSLDRTCPMGPWIVHRDALPEVDDVRIALYINGEQRQNARTSQMIFGIRKIIASLSSGMTLEPGDVIATGTPSGVGFAMTPPRFLRDQDVMRCEIEGIGVLINPVVAASAA